MKILNIIDKLIICLVTLITFVSCNFEPKQEFAKKKVIGLCQENQGMITCEIRLYNDSTFYLPSDKGFIKYSFGEFKIKKDTFYFLTKGGEINLCDKYLINKNELIPFSCTNSNCKEDKLDISFK